MTKETIELKKRIKELELINESHKNLNCGLRIELNKTAPRVFCVLKPF